MWHIESSKCSQLSSLVVTKLHVSKRDVSVYFSYDPYCPTLYFFGKPKQRSRALFSKLGSYERITSDLSLKKSSFRNDLCGCFSVFVTCSLWLVGSILTLLILTVYKWLRALQLCTSGGPVNKLYWQYGKMWHRLILSQKTVFSAF